MKSKLIVYILFLLLVSVFVTNCNKQQSTNIIRVYYNETKCSDKWGSSNIPENEKKQNIIMYFENLGIRIYDIQIVNDGTSEECKACFCKTGYRIHCKINKDDLSKFKTENFYDHLTI